MSRIRILPETLSNKIAAGEVVERPASVVKELLENAIDAKSTEVVVTITKGGRTLIRVADNGTGMDRDDALLALERYATSKIQDEEGLFSIRTLGFRGEALPSIASVSHMELVTRPDSANVGTRIVVQGGSIKQVSDVGSPVGTMISVNRLFLNTPARRKHLKTDRTEMGHISDTVTRIAMAWPHIHFKFTHNNATVGDWSPTTESGHRIADIIRDAQEDQLYNVSYMADHIHLQGYVVSPDITRSTSKGLYVYVNGRFVRDRSLDHAIREGYAHRLMKGRFPVAVLFLQIPHDRVDVNVHPTKHVVRFQDFRMVYNVVAQGVSRGLQSLDQPAWGKKPYFKPGPRQPQHVIPPSLMEVRESSIKPLARPRSSPGVRKGQLFQKVFEEKPFSNLKIIGQLHSTYIVCESEDGLVLVDQHAAHERVLFESLKEAYRRSKVVTQGLLIPEKLELNHREAHILEDLMKDLGEMGLRIEPFGGRTYVVRSVPDLLAGQSVKAVIMDIVERAAQAGVPSGLHNAVEECLIIMACHGAIRARRTLSDDEMKALLRQLDHLEDGMHCPHGRPTFIRQTLNQIEKGFKRIV